MDCDKFDKIAALYAFCMHYHSGQWSRGYRILSRIITRYRPENIPDSKIADGHEEWEASHDIYQHLVSKYADKI